MNTLNLAAKAAAGRLLGSRQSALGVRDELAELLEQSDRVEIDFENTNVTQSFVDELVGVLVLERGRPVLSKLVFKNCSPDIRATLNLVVSDRLAQRSCFRQDDDCYA